MQYNRLLYLCDSPPNHQVFFFFLLFAKFVGTPNKNSNRFQKPRLALRTTPPGTIRRSAPSAALRSTSSQPGATSATSSPHRRVPVLDATPNPLRIQLARFNLRQNGLRALQERLLHVLPRPGTGLQKNQLVFLRERARLQERHLALLLQVLFVAHQQDANVLRGQRPGVVQPVRQHVEAVPRGGIVHEQGAGRPTVVGPRDRAEPFLAGRVPDLQLDRFTADVDDARAKLDPDRVRTVLFDCVRAGKRVGENLK